MIRFRLVAVVLGIVTLAGSGAGALAAPTDSAGFPVFVHEGTCENLVEEPLADVGNAVLPAANDDDTTIGQPGDVLTTKATIDVNFDVLREHPHAIVVHESANNFSTIAACGTIGGPVTDGTLMVGLYPVGGTDVIGVAIVEEGSGVPVIGKDKTRITIYLLEGLTPPTPIPATPSGISTPIASTSALAPRS